MTEFDPYIILGLERDAGKSAIKSAYKMHAKALHPDITGGDPEKERQFIEVVRAYQLLTDPDARKLYDETGALPVDAVQERNALLSIMAGIFNQIVDMAFQKGIPLRRMDFIGEMRKVALGNAADFAKAIDLAASARVEFEDLRDRITQTGEAENVFAGHLTHRIAAKDREVVELAKAKRMSEMMMTELETYQNEVELIRVMQVSVFGGNSTNGSVYSTTVWS